MYQLLHLTKHGCPDICWPKLNYGMPAVFTVLVFYMTLCLFIEWCGDAIVFFMLHTVILPLGISDITYNRWSACWLLRREASHGVWCGFMVLCYIPFPLGSCSLTVVVHLNKNSARCCRRSGIAMYEQYGVEVFLLISVIFVHLISLHAFTRT